MKLSTQGLTSGRIHRCATELLSAREDIERLTRWVNDLQSGMYINCVYCGHRYGPEDEVPATMADVLKEHIEQCPKHPMSALKQRIAALEAENARLQDNQGNLCHANRELKEQNAALRTQRDARIKALEAVADAARQHCSDRHMFTENLYDALANLDAMKQKGHES